MSVFDLFIGSDFDLAIADGDLLVRESTRQHQLLLLHTNAGEWRESPTVGVNANHFLNDDADRATLMNEIKKQFVQDGMTLDQVTGDAFYNDEWKITANAQY